MAETYTGHVQNGVVVFEGDVPPEGTAVRVEPVGAGAGSGDRIAGKSPLLALIETLEAMPGDPEWPADASTQHDHYLYGTPKRP